MARRRIRWSSGSTRPGGILAGRAPRHRRRGHQRRRDRGRADRDSPAAGREGAVGDPADSPRPGGKRAHDDGRWQLPTGQQHAVVAHIMYEQWLRGTAPGLGPVGNPSARWRARLSGAVVERVRPRVTGSGRCWSCCWSVRCAGIGLPERHPRRDGAGQPASHRRRRPRDMRPMAGRRTSSRRPGPAHSSGG